MTSTPGFEPGPHWWETSALATAPPLLRYWINLLLLYLVFLGQPRNKQRKVGRWLSLSIGRGFPTSGRCPFESGNRVILHCWRGAHWHDRKSCGAWQQYWNIQLWYSTSQKNWKGNYRSRQVTRYVRLRYLESLAYGLLDLAYYFNTCKKAGKKRKRKHTPTPIVFMYYIINNELVITKGYWSSAGDNDRMSNG